MILLMMTILADPASASPAVLAPVAVTQSRSSAVAVGNPLRRVLLNAMRPGLANAVGQPVEFIVETLQVEGDWAFFMGSIQQPNGRPIDFSHTAYAERIELGAFDGPATVALMHRVGEQWQLVDFLVGPTDMGHWAWSDQYGAPSGLLGVGE